VTLHEDGTLRVIAEVSTRHLRNWILVANAVCWVLIVVAFFCLLR
jgi:hypothetical protein